MAIIIINIARNAIVVYFNYIRIKYSDNVLQVFLQQQLINEYYGNI